jgi:radical SAM protein with 4Fe4S-binding SPASM domain
LNNLINQRIEKIDSGLDNRIYNIENGYFIFSLFATLRCSLDCPHCYLSKYDRKYSPAMDMETEFRQTCIKINDYFMNNINNGQEKKIIFYWYGGEITELGPSYLYHAKRITDEVMDKSIIIKHEILSALMGNVKIWVPLLKNMCDSVVQTSYDYLMRGKNYLTIWKKNVKYIIESGVKVSVINVINKTMVGKEQIIYDDLIETGIHEIGFLQFMKNSTNMAEHGKDYLENSATMAEFSEFLINFTKIALKNFDIKKDNYGMELIIGPMHRIFFNKFLNERGNTNPWNNIAGQTMYLLPKGDFVLADYEDNYFEKEDYVKKFGTVDKSQFEMGDTIDNSVESFTRFENIYEKSFEEVLNSKGRQDLMQKQLNRNNNEECKNCQFQNVCIIEMWKNINIDNSGECPGNKRYIEFLYDFYDNMEESVKIQFKESFNKTVIH